MKPRVLFTNHRGLLQVLPLLLILAVGATAFYHPVSAAPAQQSCGAQHTVKAGETLSSIGETYKVSWVEIATANNLTDPYTVTIDQVLCIPGAASAPSTTPSTGSEAASSGKKSGPTLSLSGYWNYLQITVTNFPKETNYYVKAAPAAGWLKEWNQLGKVRTDRKGAVTIAYRLPKSLLDTQSIEVCLKDALSDEVACNVYDNTDYLSWKTWRFGFGR